MQNCYKMAVKLEATNVQGFVEFFRFSVISEYEAVNGCVFGPFSHLGFMAAALVVNLLTNAFSSRQLILQTLSTVHHPPRNRRGKICEKHVNTVGYFTCIKWTVSTIEPSYEITFPCPLFVLTCSYNVQTPFSWWMNEWIFYTMSVHWRVYLYHEAFRDTNDMNVGLCCFVIWSLIFCYHHTVLCTV